MEQRRLLTPRLPPPVVVLLLLLLSLDLGGVPCLVRADHVCHEGDKTVHRGSVRDIQTVTTETTEIKGAMATTLYVDPKPDFKGVILTTRNWEGNNDIWLDLKEHDCFQKYMANKWWELRVKAKVHGDDLVIFEAETDACQVECIRRGIYSIYRLTVKAFGASVWRVTRPPHYCLNEVTERLSQGTQPTCTNPPVLSSTTTTTTPPTTARKTTTITTTTPPTTARKTTTTTTTTPPTTARKTTTSTTTTTTATYTKVTAPSTTPTGAATSNSLPSTSRHTPDSSKGDDDKSISVTEIVVVVVVVMLILMVAVAVVVYRRKRKSAASREVLCHSGPAAPATQSQRDVGNTPHESSYQHKHSAGNEDGRVTIENDLYASFDQHENEDGTVTIENDLYASFDQHENEDGRVTIENDLYASFDQHENPAAALQQGEGTVYQENDLYESYDEYRCTLR